MVFQNKKVFTKNVSEPNEKYRMYQNFYTAKIEPIAGAAFHQVLRKTCLQSDYAPDQSRIFGSTRDTIFGSTNSLKIGRCGERSIWPFNVNQEEKNGGANTRWT